MPLESASYISQLVSANPPGSDPMSGADDHLRLIKQVLQTSFPNVNAAVTATPLQLSSQFVPIGAAVIWTQSLASIPAGWVVAVGQTVARSDGAGNITLPDLRNKFIVGAGATYSVGATGGALTHSHGSVTGTHVLSNTEMPLHNHSLNDPGHSHSLNDPGHRHGYLEFFPTNTAAGPGSSNPCVSGGNGAQTTDFATTGISMGSAATGITLATSGGSGGHNHTISSDDNIPPYYALAYIVKI